MVSECFPQAHERYTEAKRLQEEERTAKVLQRQREENRDIEALG
jgi:hypothetical protein